LTSFSFAGGSSGIGLATAELLFENGATVIIADINSPQVDKASSSRWKYIKTDVREWSSLLSFFKQSFELHGKIDIVIISAGVADSSDMFSDTFNEEGDLQPPNLRSIEINLMGGLSCIKLAVHFFSKNDQGGKIVIVGSLAWYSVSVSRRAYPGLSSFQAWSFGLHAFHPVQCWQVQCLNQHDCALGDGDTDGADTGIGDAQTKGDRSESV